MIKAYGYVRVSGRKQIDGHGFERQMDSINKLCKAEGYQIEKIFKEQISGTNDETERPEFSSMCAEILSNGIRIVIVESLDRLAREYRIQEQLLIYLSSKGIDLIAANTGENVTKAISDDPMKKALVQMQGVFAELDKSQTIRKLKKARDKIRNEKGKCEGPKRYGETKEEAAILKRVRYMRRRPKNKGKPRTFQSIADQLNTEGIKTRQGKEWNAALIYNILKK
jgi:DNA invertase Pin-like site-specific DNA recombinase